MLLDTAPPRAPLPPGPRAPAFIQALMLLDEPLKLLQKAHRRYGDVFTMRYAGLGPVVHVTTPADVRALFSADPDVAFAGEANYSLFGPIVGRGTLFTMEGAAHRKRRRLIMPSFHGEHIQEYATVMRDATRRAIRRWPLGKELALYEEMQTVTLEVILRAVFGLEDGPETRELCELLAALSGVGIGSPYLLLPHLQLDLGPRSPWGRVMRLRRDTHRAMDREVARRRQDPDAAKRSDILSLLLQVRDEDGALLTDEQLRDELILLLIAGHETTATSLAWAFATILEHHDVVAKIRDEIETATGGATLERDHFGKLPYLDAVIKEAMRLRPITPATAGRILKAPLKLRDHTIPAGVLCSACAPILHRRPELYPDPNAFKPERFVGKKVDPYEWLPFGGGVRRCLGMAFALHEIKVVLATVLRETSLDLVATPANGRRGFFISPRDGTRVIVHERKAPHTN